MRDTGFLGCLFLLVAYSILCMWTDRSLDYLFLNYSDKMDNSPFYLSMIASLFAPPAVIFNFGVEIVRNFF